MTGRTVVVTGGSGYLGTVLVRHFHACGDRVSAFDLNSPHGHPDGVRFVRADVRDTDAVRQALDGADAVVHAVAMVPLTRNVRTIESVNVGGTRSLLTAARDAGVPKVVWISSSAVYGIPERNPVDENAPQRPVEPYGRSKAAGEDLCREAALGGLDVTIVRPRTILGAGRLGIMSVLFDWVADGAPVFVLGKGDNRYQFVHATDVAEACRLASEREGPRDYNVGAATFGTMRDTLQTLIDHAGTNSRVISVPAAAAAIAMRALSAVRLAPFAPYHWLAYGRSIYFDITRARTELGWVPAHSNASAIVEAYDWFLARRDERPGGRSQHATPVRQGALRAVKVAAELLTRGR